MSITLAQSRQKIKELEEEQERVDRTMEIKNPDEIDSFFEDKGFSIVLEYPDGKTKFSYVLKISHHGELLRSFSENKSEVPPGECSWLELFQTELEQAYHLGFKDGYNYPQNQRFVFDGA